MRRQRLAAIIVLLWAGVGQGQLITPQEAQRQKQVLAGLEQALARQKDDAGKFSQLQRVLREEPAGEVRGKVLAMAAKLGGPHLEPFLTGMLDSEKDSGLRSQAAATLGRTGSEKSIAVLARVARSDKPTPRQIGCIRSTGTARRSATFALAELARRFPRSAGRIAEELRRLPARDDPADNESLGDARIQALYQVTRDRALLKPFFERLKSPKPADRVRGVVAFRFLKLSEAPPQLLQLLKDPDSRVRSWVPLVLGGIGDRKTAGALMAAAADRSLDAATRCNAIVALGTMKVAAAAELMEKLLTDPQPAVPRNAAVALYRITGKKVKQFPKGYDAD